MSLTYTSFYLSSNNLLFALEDCQDRPKALESARNKLRADPSVKAVGVITFENGIYRACALTPNKISMNDSRKLILSLSKLSLPQLDDAIQL
jgi:hypothetical protein